MVVGVSYGWSASADDDDIIAITQWPAVQSQTECAAKVPTQISYEADDTGDSAHCWGYLIEPGAPRCAWMKLLLDKNSRVTPNDDPDLKNDLNDFARSFPTGKDAQNVTVDFFKELYAFTMTNLKRDYPDKVIDLTPIKYWFTMPAIWSDEAQIRTLQAAKKGGFATRKGDEVFVIPEPEAAALATLTSHHLGYGDYIDVSKVSTSD